MIKLKYEVIKMKLKYLSLLLSSICIMQFMTVSSLANAQAMEANTNDKEIPGPAYNAAPIPVKTKIPVPITLPIPKNTKSNALRFLVRPDFCAIERKAPISFLRNKSIKNTPFSTTRKHHLLSLFFKNKGLVKPGLSFLF